MRDTLLFTLVCAMLAISEVEAQAPQIRVHYEEAAKVHDRAAQQADQQCPQSPQVAQCYRSNAVYYRCLAKSLGGGTTSCGAAKTCGHCARGGGGGGGGEASEGAAMGEPGVARGPVTGSMMNDPSWNTLSDKERAVFGGIGSVVDIMIARDQQIEAERAAEAERQRQIDERNAARAQALAQAVASNRSAPDYGAFMFDMSHRCKLGVRLNLDGYEADPVTAANDIQTLREEASLYESWRGVKRMWNEWVNMEQQILGNELVLAVINGQPPQVRALLKAGARADAMGSTGATAFDLALDSPNLDLKIEMLLYQFEAPQGRDHSFTSLPVSHSNPPVRR